VTLKATPSSLENLRIAVVLTTLDLGGAERQALHLASYLQDECRARVAVVGLFGGLGDQPVRRMCIERRLACLRVNMPEHDRGVPTFKSIRQFARDMAFLQPDILLPYTSLPNVLCGVVWQTAGAKACIWNQRDEGRELPLSRWHNQAMKNTGHFISNSRDGAEFLVSQRGVSREKIDLVFNGVELRPPCQARDAVRETLGVRASSFMAVMLANIHQYKDHATLVRAWKIVCDRLPDLDPILVLAGRKDDSDTLKRLIASLQIERQVRMTGPVADVSSLLHAADLSVFSSRYEGMPNAVLESMAAGLAVVATDISGCRDALGENYPALVPPENPEAMAEKIIAFAQDKKTRSEVGAALARRASDEFSVAKMCEQSRQIILRMLNSSRC
jgi:glycosyltransferase involved in cell wall biosynthesis